MHDQFNQISSNLYYKKIMNQKQKIMSLINKNIVSDFSNTKTISSQIGPLQIIWDEKHFCFRVRDGIFHLKKKICFKLM